MIYRSRKLNVYISPEFGTLPIIRADRLTRCRPDVNRRLCDIAMIFADLLLPRPVEHNIRKRPGDRSELYLISRLLFFSKQPTLALEAFRFHIKLEKPSCEVCVLDSTTVSRCESCSGLVVTLTFCVTTYLAFAKDLLVPLKCHLREVEVMTFRNPLRLH